MRTNKHVMRTNMCDVEYAHSDPVTDLVWKSDKSGTKFVTTSTDGKLLFWDFRK
jgi:dynein intermediate chain 2